MNSCKHAPQDLNALFERKKDYLGFEGAEKLTWCGGCGDFSIQKALERALVLEGRTAKDTLFCFDIGCHGNGSDKIGGTTLHGLHGRVIPAAAGAALANPNIKVIAEGGDGGTLSEGINHLVHAVRSNYPMLFILHNNENYGLTIGQASATTRKGCSMNGAPDGVALEPMNACQFVLSLRPGFVARSFSGDVKHMTEMMRRGLQYNGFAFLEVMQVCPTFNKATSQKWYWDRVRDVEEDPSYDPADLKKAWALAEDLEKQIAVGVLYETKKPSFLELLPQRKDVKTSAVDEVRPYDITPLLAEFE